METKKIILIFPLACKFLSDKEISYKWPQQHPVVPTLLAGLI